MFNFEIVHRHNSNIRTEIVDHPNYFINRNGEVRKLVPTQQIYNHWSILPCMVDKATGREYVYIEDEKCYIDYLIVRHFGSKINRKRLQQYEHPTILHNNGIMSDNRASNLCVVHAEEYQRMMKRIRKQRIDDNMKAMERRKKYYASWYAQRDYTPDYWISR